MQDLLPLLETLTEHHPSVEVQEMASDLRIAIATHGVVWSHKMNDAAKNLGKQAKGVKSAASGRAGNEGTLSKSVDCSVVLSCCL